MTQRQDRETRGGPVEDPSHSETHIEARRTLEAFASVGAVRFDLTLSTSQGNKVDFKRSVSFKEISRRISDVLDRATKNQWNVIIRPKSPPVFLQLDDLDLTARDRVKVMSFLSLETSPCNYQAWIALLNATYMAPIRRIKKNIGADPSASGATRIAGSFNFKAKYSPTFPRVAISHVNPGVLVSIPQLAEIGLVYQDDYIPLSRVRGPLVHRFAKMWPSYERCVAGAPLNHDGNAPDISRADFTFCIIAIDWGWSVEETAEKLMEVSRKAHRNGEGYAILTARHASEALAQR